MDCPFPAFTHKISLATTDESLPTCSTVSSVTLNRFERAESMFVVKVAVKEAVVQIGWGVRRLHGSEVEEKSKEHSAMQISFCILLMFQSTENLDSSGKRVIHASFDNLWSSMVKDFAVVSLYKCTPLLAPFACEFRAVSSTANFGEVVCQDLALDSDSIEVSISKHNLAYLTEMLCNFVEECRLLGSMLAAKTTDSSFITKYKNQGRSIATTVGFQLQPWSFTLLSQANPNVAIEPLLNIRGAASGKVDGCMCALSGELKIETSLFFFSRNVGEWVHLMETLCVSVELEYQPNDVVRSTGILLLQYCVLEFTHLSAFMYRFSMHPLITMSASILQVKCSSDYPKSCTSRRTISRI